MQGKLRSGRPQQPGVGHALGCEVYCNVYRKVCKRQGDASDLMESDGITNERLIESIGTMRENRELGRFEVYCQSTVEKVLRISSYSFRVNDFLSKRIISNKIQAAK
jgi:hypothetical protein